MRTFVKYALLVVVAVAFSIFGIGRLPQSIVIITLSSGCIYFIRRKVKNEKMRMVLSALFLIGFLLHVFISLSLYDKTVDTKYYGFSYQGDDYIYGDFGAIVGNLWRKGVFLSRNKLIHFSLIGEYAAVQAYQLYCAGIFYFFGASGGQILLILNSFFHAAIIIPAYFICKRLNIKCKVITIVLSLLLFWPSTFFWALFNFKEPVMLLALFSVFSLILRLQEKPILHDVFFMGVFSCILFSAKGHFTVLIPLIILHFFVLWRWKYKAVAALGFALIFILRQVFLKPVLSNLYVILSSLPKRLSDSRYSCFFTNTGYFCNVPSDTCLSTLLYFPFGFGAALFLPFLLRPFKLHHIAANIESIVWWLLIPFLINGIWIAVRKETRKTFIMLSTFFFWISALALTQASMGTLLRQKAIIYYIGFVFIGLAIDRTLKKVEAEGLGML